MIEKPGFYNMHWREKDWVWRASEGSLRQAVVAAADRIDALEAALNTMPAELYDTQGFGERLNSYRTLVGLKDARKANQ